MLLLINMGKHNDKITRYLRSVWEGRDALPLFGGKAAICRLLHLQLAISTVETSNSGLARLSYTKIYFCILWYYLNKYSEGLLYILNIK